MSSSSSPKIIQFGRASTKVINCFQSSQCGKSLSLTLKELLRRTEETLPSVVDWNVSDVDIEDVDELDMVLVDLDNFMGKLRLNSRAAAIELLMLCDRKSRCDVGVQTEDFESSMLLNLSDHSQLLSDEDSLLLCDALPCKIDDVTKNTFSCDICKNIFPSRNLLQDHMQIHSNKDLQMQFKQSAVVNETQTEDASSKDPSHTCRVCGKTLSSKSHLENHLKTHEKKRHLCDLCGKTFTLLRGLQIHLKLHTDERPYVCEICGKRYLRKIHLSEHLTLHTGEKRYKCKFCEKHFRKYCSKLKHERIHSEIRPFICSLCDHRGFTQKYNLLCHMRKFHKVNNGIASQ